LTEGGPGNGEMDDDHWDETNGNQDDYDDVNAHRIFELVLMMKSSDLSEEQEQNFKKILKGASDAMEPTNWKQRLAGKFLDVNQKMKEIQEGNQRIVLKKEEYIDCRKFKRNVYDQVDRHLGKGRHKKDGKKNSADSLPQFEILVMSTQHSLKYNLGQTGNTQSTKYEDRQSMLATKQTRTKYLFHYTPVMKRIVGNNERKSSAQSE